MAELNIQTVVMTVDRIEEGYVILIPREYPEEIIRIPRQFLKGFEEGDTVEFSIRRDETAAQEARDRITEPRERMVNY